jgi:hypothetical protein
MHDSSTDAYTERTPILGVQGLYDENTHAACSNV